MTDYAVDPSASRLIVRTRATGLLARLAHDLELAAEGLRGLATSDGDSWTAELSVPVGSIRVAGALRGDALDTGALSASDRAEIERKLREEVLGRAREITARAGGADRRAGEVTVTLGRVSGHFHTSLSTRADSGGLVATGRCTLTLSALGIAPVKGPLGAFKVNDVVEVRYELTLRPAEGEGPPQAA